jgi:hypothetical protein
MVIPYDHPKRYGHPKLSFTCWSAGAQIPRNATSDWLLLQHLTAIVALEGRFNFLPIHHLQAKVVAIARSKYTAQNSTYDRRSLLR